MPRPGSSRSPGRLRPMKGSDRSDDDGGDRAPTPRLVEHFADALVELRAFLSDRRDRRHADIEKELSEVERRIRRQWPEATPSDDGQAQLDKILKRRARWMKWRVRTVIADDLVSIGCKASLMVACGVYVAKQAPW